LPKRIEAILSQLFHVRPTKYPVSERFKVIEGYDIYRSDQLIIAIVVVESEKGILFRLTA